MRIDSHKNLPQEQAVTVLQKLLGNLELEVMDFMWQVRKATVRQVMEVINHRRPVVYTTVMTVMGHLVDKGLLTRTLEGNRYRYRVAQGKQEFLHETSRHMIRTLVGDFGDIAITQFLGEIDKVDVDRLVGLREQV